MYLLCKWIHENTDIRVLLTGEISDELFGYKYTDFAPSPEEFQKESQKRVRELYMYDVLRADRCISVNSLEARKESQDRVRVVGTTYFGLTLFDMTLTKDSYTMNSAAEFLSGKPFASFLPMKIKK